MMRSKQIVSIHGVPRSGTSWLGQIVNSHPNVITLQSNRNTIGAFLEELYKVKDDDFILNKEEIDQKIYPVFKKVPSPNFLVMKMVRYHHLIEKFIKDIDQIKIIGIVRNPCAVINSWIQAPKEFNKEWNPLEEWRHASQKNKGRIEEFYGFEKWKAVANMFLDFKDKFPQQFYLIQYEALVNNLQRETNKLFKFIGIDMQSQVIEFIKYSQKYHNDHPNSVFKKPNVKDRWKLELCPFIKKKIVKEVCTTRLERFLS